VPILPGKRFQHDKARDRRFLDLWKEKPQILQEIFDEGDGVLEILHRSRR
jgi:hypothetical protein